MKSLKNAKVYIASLSMVLAFGLPVLAAGNVYALDNGPQITPLRCSTPIVPDFDGPIFLINGSTTEGCDLAVNKQVSVNGGAFTDADTTSTAATATVGDTITYKITLTDNSDEGNSINLKKFKVGDILPAGVTFVSATVTTGDYAANVWTIESETFDDDGLTVNLPATLTIVTTANAQGVIKNTAELSDFDPCIDGCLGFNGYYLDSNSDNNSNDAYVNVAAKPQVLGTTTTTTTPTAVVAIAPAKTLVNTGTNLVKSVIAATLILTTIVVLGYDRLFKKS